MTNIIAHRGPDDEGFVLIARDLHTVIPFGGPSTPSNVYAHTLPYLPHRRAENQVQQCLSQDISILLGHRRLSIVDLSPNGHQPMCLHKQFAWITYNGEVYNYLEIRQELENVGYTFHTRSDTEVILAAYQHWGKACLHKFNGMFAFVIIDLKQQRLFAARDRFGVKPLYFWQAPTGTLAFASEIKQFTVLPEWRPFANVSRAIDYLTSGLTDFSAETLFQGVFQLRGGEYIDCSLKTPAIPMPKRWYQLKKTPSMISFEHAKSEFNVLFEDAVRLRLRSDVDVGSCLSGGLDSSAIVCMVNRLLIQTNRTDRQNTFSACSHIPRFDERNYMEEVIQQTQVKGHFVTPSLDQLMPLIKKIVWQQDEPFGSSSIFAQYLVFELAKKNGITVMLDGQGADELLAGYTQFWPAHFGELLKALKWPTFLQEYKIANQLNPSTASSSLSMLKQLLPESMANILTALRHKSPIKSLLAPWISFPQSAYKSIPACLDIHASHLVDKQSFKMLHQTSLPALLRYEDRNSMAHSIEARTPFLDYRLVEFIYNLPPQYKIFQGYTKSILRESLEILPEKVRWRTDKLGFATAEENWMCIEKPDFFRQEIADAVHKSRGLINTQAINLADKILSGRKSFDWTLWRMINLGYWMDIFNISLP